MKELATKNDRNMLAAGSTALRWRRTRRWLRLVDHRHRHVDQRERARRRGGDCGCQRRAGGATRRSQSPYDRGLSSRAASPPAGTGRQATLRSQPQRDRQKRLSPNLRTNSGINSHDRYCPSVQARLRNPKGSGARTLASSRGNRRRRRGRRRLRGHHHRGRRRGRRRLLGAGHKKRNGHYGGNHCRTTYPFATSHCLGHGVHPLLLYCAARRQNEF
jgi:hypothetical protein